MASAPNITVAILKFYCGRAPGGPPFGCTIHGALLVDAALVQRLQASPSGPRVASTGSGARVGFGR